MSPREAQTCEDLGYDVVLRVAQDRAVEMPEGDIPEELDEKHLKALARALPGVDAHVVSIPAQHHQPKREAMVQMNFQQVRVHAAPSRSLLEPNGDHRLGRAGLLPTPT